MGGPSLLHLYQHALSVCPHLVSDRPDRLSRGTLHGHAVRHASPRGPVAVYRLLCRPVRPPVYHGHCRRSHRHRLPVPCAGGSGRTLSTGPILLALALRSVGAPFTAHVFRRSRLCWRRPTPYPDAPAGPRGFRPYPCSSLQRAAAVLYDLVVRGSLPLSAVLLLDTAAPPLLSWRWPPPASPSCVWEIPAAGSASGGTPGRASPSSAPSDGCGNFASSAPFFLWPFFRCPLSFPS